jgi:hypothetical protein
MPSSINALSIRKRLGPHVWSAPQQFGPDGWLFRTRDNDWHVIVTVAERDDGTEWVHASMAGPRLPSYDQLCLLHHAVFDEGYAYQCFVPTDHHVNIHPRALHLWGRLDGAAVLPEFSGYVNGRRSI